MALLLDYWKPIVGFEFKYEISICGHVRRIYNPSNRRSNYGLKPLPTVAGYSRVNIANNDGLSSFQYIHRLVAATFLGPCPANHEVNHKNFDTACNRLSNLEYLSPQENARYSMAAGRRPVKDPNKPKKTWADVARTCKREPKICKYCGSQFMAVLAKVKRGEGKYCSLACRGLGAAKTTNDILLARKKNSL